ncbi:MAG: hypothetical protein U1D30_08670 [Planctomycetota bacterium]
MSGFVYNDLGQLIRHVSFEGRVTVYAYDNTAGSSGRLVRKEYFASVAAWDNGEGEPDETVDFTYDAFGRVVETDDSAHGVTTNAFDDQGRLITVTLAGRHDPLRIRRGQQPTDPDLHRTRGHSRQLDRR